ncbi:hypothetical protein HMPREF1989_00110 [Porphyromonas gingivalis F0566]|nr:hypothetical protein HMPREF1989_00110 [Porphyromonas gingivalis F0566]
MPLRPKTTSVWSRKYVPLYLGFRKSRILCLHILGSAVEDGLSIMGSQDV